MNDERNIAGYLRRLKCTLLYQSMGCVRPLGKSCEQCDRTGRYKGEVRGGDVGESWVFGGDALEDLDEGF